MSGSQGLGHRSDSKENKCLCDGTFLNVYCGGGYLNLYVLIVLEMSAKKSASLKFNFTN